MGIKRMTEKELLAGLNADRAHADELAEPIPHELSPLERLKDTVKRYDRPTDPVWEEYCDSDECARDQFMKTSLVFGAIPEEIFDSPKAFIEAVKIGIPGAWLASAANASGHIDVFGSALQLPAEKVELIFKIEVLDPGSSEIILDVVRLLQLCESVWESRELATRWLNLPAAALGGAVPAKLVDTFEGRRWISQVLSKIEQGQFS
ncbi:MAG: antitoxin Xre/MbcA/ParS toxin-binding domain-containing protein [Marinobacter sp.]